MPASFRFLKLASWLNVIGKSFTTLDLAWYRSYRVNTHSLIFSLILLNASSIEGRSVRAYGILIPFTNSFNVGETTSTKNGCVVSYSCESWILIADR